MLERECARPFAHRVRDCDVAGEGVTHEHVVRIGSMVHQVHEDGVTGQRMTAGLVLVLDGHLVEEIQQPAGGPISEMVVRDDVEEGHDLVDVAVDNRPGLARGCTLVNGMPLDRVTNDGVAEQLLSHVRPARQLVAIDARA